MLARPDQAEAETKSKTTSCEARATVARLAENRYCLER
jgi:hypothetical protein